jgi:hypothetical protein
MIEQTFFAHQAEDREDFSRLPTEPPRPTEPIPNQKPGHEVGDSASPVERTDAQLAASDATQRFQDEGITVTFTSYLSGKVSVANSRFVA